MHDTAKAALNGILIEATYAHITICAYQADMAEFIRFQANVTAPSPNPRRRLLEITTRRL